MDVSEFHASKLIFRRRLARSGAGPGLPVGHFYYQQLAEKQADKEG
jgi:hypothetical protein